MLIADAIRVVLSDYDDTLVSTWGPKSRQHQHVARTYYGKELDESEIRRHWGKPLLELLCLLYGTDDAEQALANSHAHSEQFPKICFPSTLPTLCRLRQLGKRLGIVTATIRRNLEHDLNRHAIPLEWFDYRQTAEDTDVHKPDPRVFDPAIAWLRTQGIRADETLYLGDGLHDLYAARGAGFQFIGVETGLVTAEEFQAEGAISVPTLADLVR